MRQQNFSFWQGYSSPVLFVLSCFAHVSVFAKIPGVAEASNLGLDLEKRKSKLQQMADAKNAK